METLFANFRFDANLSTRLAWEHLQCMIRMGRGAMEETVQIRPTEKGTLWIAGAPNAVQGQ